MNKGLVLILFIVVSITLFGQNKVYVVGRVTDAETKQPIVGAHIKVDKKNIGSITKNDGSYKLSTHKKEKLTLIFSHIGYETVYNEVIIIEQDTVEVDVRLKIKINVIPDYIHRAKGEPIKVFGSTKISIADFEFHQNNFIFLGYKKTLNKNSELYLVDEKENILHQHFIPGKPVELYTDYLGSIHLICENAIYRVEVNRERITLVEIPLNDFNEMIKPILDTLEGSYLFSNFLRQFPRFKYYAFSPKDTAATLIKEVVHKDMDWQYQFEYYNLNNADKQFAKRMAKRLNGYDKYDIAASMTGFSNDFRYEPVYAPLFVVNDTINIFDHYENKIWKFIDDSVEVGSVDINYHHPKKQNEWKKKLIMDEVNGDIYGVFLRNGYYYLKEISIQTGKVIDERKLNFKYVSKIKIKEGFVFYTYKPTETLQKKFLYKERL